MAEFIDAHFVAHCMRGYTNTLASTASRNLSPQAANPGALLFPQTRVSLSMHHRFILPVLVFPQVTFSICKENR